MFKLFKVDCQHVFFKTYVFFSFEIQQKSLEKLNVQKPEIHNISLHWTFTCNFNSRLTVYHKYLKHKCPVFSSQTSVMLKQKVCEGSLALWNSSFTLVFRVKESDSQSFYCQTSVQFPQNGHISSKIKTKTKVLHEDVFKTIHIFALWH